MEEQLPEGLLCPPRPRHRRPPCGLAGASVTPSPRQSECRTLFPGLEGEKPGQKKPVTFSGEEGTPWQSTLPKPWRSQRCGHGPRHVVGAGRG